MSMVRECLKANGAFIVTLMRCERSETQSHGLSAMDGGWSELAVATGSITIR